MRPGVSWPQPLGDGSLELLSQRCSCGVSRRRRRSRRRQGARRLAARWHHPFRCVSQRATRHRFHPAATRRRRHIHSVQRHCAAPGFGSWGFGLSSEEGEVVSNPIAPNVYSGFAKMAERGGFEPPIRLLTVYRFSKPAPSATRPSLLLSKNRTERESNTGRLSLDSARKQRETYRPRRGSGQGASCAAVQKSPFAGVRSD